MKIIGIIGLLVIIGVSSSSAQEKCVQGDSYEVDCNTCTCTDSGIYACTRRACYHGPTFPDTAGAGAASRKRRQEPVCKEGESYQEDCNTCTCTNSGIYACTRRACYHGPTHADTIAAPAPAASRRRRQEPVAASCTHGQSYEEDCNTCTCQENGIYICTLRACYHGPLFPDTPEVGVATVVTSRKRRQEPVCKEGESYQEDCNTCTCTNTGVYACTRRACYHGPTHADTIAPAPAKTRKRRQEPVAASCTQGHSYEEDCNTCTCQENGIYVCTRRACYHGPLFPDTVTAARKSREISSSTGKYDHPKQNALPHLSYEVERCSPNEVKNKGCNRCKCTKHGKGYMCTTRSCESKN